MRLAVVFSVVLSWLALVLAARTAEARITFQAGPSSIDLSGDPPSDGVQAIAVADLNHDGKADLIVVHQASGDISVFLNSGSGAFNSPMVLSSDLSPIAVTTGDFDNDGNVDMAVVNDDDTVTTYLGDSAGNFTEPGNNYAVCGNDFGAVGVLAAHLDDDLYDDLAVLCDGSVYLLKSTGNGTFSAFSTPSINTRGSGNFAIAARRINSSHNYVDLAISSAGTESVTVLFGNNDGTFQSPFVIQSGLSNPQGLAIGQFYGDSNPDIAVISGTGIDATVDILEGDGAGGFTIQDTKSTSQAETGSDSIVALDLDGDGKTDLAVGSSDADFGLIALFCQQPSSVCNDGANTVVANFQIQTIIGALNGLVTAIQSGDLNGDNKPDLVGLNSDSSTIKILLNTTGSQTQTPTPLTSPSGTLQPTATPTPTVPTSTPTRTFTPPPTVTPTPIPTAPYGVCTATVGVPAAQGNIDAVAIGNFNALDDGTLDIASADKDGNRVIVSFTDISNTGATACEVLGLNRKKTPVPLTVTAPMALAAKDLTCDTCDSKVDLAVVGSQGLTVFFGDGHGSFPNRVDLAAGTSLSALAIADFNGDNKPDLIVANAGSNDVSIFLGDGQGGFSSPCEWPVQISPALVLAGDLNRDGLQDFAVANNQDEVLVVFLQNAATPAPSAGAGCPSFTRHVANLAGRPQAMALGNFESGNVIPDFVVGLSSGSVQVMLGSLSSDAITYQSLTSNLLPQGAKPQPAAIGVADVYGDGRTGIIEADKANGNIDIFLSNGTSTFKSLDPFAVGANPIALAVADIDSDGVYDVVTGNTDGSISILLTSRPPSTPTPLPTHTPTVTGTPTETGTPTLTPTPTPSTTATPSATGTRTPTLTPSPSPVPTHTMRPGAINLQGSCAVDPAADPSNWSWLVLSAIVVGGLAGRRIARPTTE
jgi:hypothetical protein